MRFVMVLVAALVALLVSAGTASAAPTDPVVPWGDPVAVARVVDGDTFTTSTGQSVRVLGIDSCEMSTPGGRDAKATAESLLPVGRVVVLVREPSAPDTDRYGRLLRYVRDTTGTEDFGLAMTRHPHTGVYAGRNDAGPEYLAQLAELGGPGVYDRDCGDQPPPAPATEDHYVPTPDSGGGGGESRYCSRRWWC